MPFVPVPKDLTKVKTKVAFNLTKRQLICFGGGALVGVPTYIFTRGSSGNETSALLMIGLMLPFFLFGIYEKDGQPLERMLGHFIRTQFVYPKTRPYRTENMYSVLSNNTNEEAKSIGKQTAGKAGKTPVSRAKTAKSGKGGGKGHTTHP